MLIAGMALFGSATPVSKIVGEHFPVLTASLLRVGLGALVLLPFVLRDLPVSVRRIERGDWIYIVLIALFGMVGFTVLLIYGMQFVSAVAGSIVMAFTPALTAAAACVFMRAPMDWRRALAITLGVAGIIFLHVFRGKFADQADSPLFYVGVALVLGAIACEAAYTLLGKRATRNVPPLLASLLACILSVPLFVVLAVFDAGDLDFSEIPLAAWSYLLRWGAGSWAPGPRSGIPAWPVPAARRRRASWP